MKYFLPLTLCLASPLLADPPTIENVTASRSAGVWTFNVTIRHGDKGWDDYADGWRVLDMNGDELGLRTLYHPHVNEQPFTRSLGSVEIPSGIQQVMIEARDSVGGWSGQPVVFDLP